MAAYKSIKKYINIPLLLFSECVCLYEHVLHVCGNPWKPGGEVRFSGPGVAGGCEYWKQNSGPLEEPHVLLTTKPSLYTDFPVQCRSALASENILKKIASNHPQYLQEEFLNSLTSFCQLQLDMQLIEQHCKKDYLSNSPKLFFTAPRKECQKYQ